MTVYLARNIDWFNKFLAESVTSDAVEPAGPTPRATKDIDLVIGLKLIADQGPNERFAEVLAQHGYSVTELNPRWQFENTLRHDRKVVVELHASLPWETHPNLSVDDIRVKHKPSLGKAGVHGRTNPEAVGRY